jgi:RNA polymerase sigma factor (TIGR02999 family)
LQAQVPLIGTSYADLTQFSIDYWWLIIYYSFGGDWFSRKGMSEVTRILNALEQGDARAADELLPLVYEELRLLAAKKMSQELPGQTLQATALVHEAYIRLVEASNQNWDSRGHFFAAAAEAMRRILVENARRKRSFKHGGDQQRVDLDDAYLAIEAPSGDLIALDEALTKLSETDPAVAELVKLRYFAGLTIEQVAQYQGLSRRTAVDHWAYARAWLRREISKESEPDSS